MVSGRPSLPGTHRVTKKLSGGRFAIYWYSCRGGTLLVRFDGESRAAALSAERAGATALASAYALRRARPQPARMRLRDVVMAYKTAPDGFLRLKSSTRGEWLRWLDEITAQFGDMRTEALNAKGARTVFREWRDRRAQTPRAADYGVQVLKRLLSWALEAQLVEANPAEGIRGLYRNDRADVIVEDHELTAILSHATENARHAIRLAAATGMRRGDLVRMKWSHVTDNSIIMETEKSNRRRRIIVPLLADGHAVLNELRNKRDALIALGKVLSAFVLTTKHGGAWTGDGVTQAFIRAAARAGVDKNLHDLRGTAVTRLVLAQISDEEIAEIVGWEPTRVRGVRRYYVDRDRVALGIVQRVEAATKRAEGGSAR